MSETSLEKKIVAAAFKDRKAYDKIVGASDADTSYTPYASQLLKLFGEYYERDDEARAVDADVIRHWIEERVTPKNQPLYVEYLGMVASTDVSAVNISDLVVSTKKRALGNELAAALLDNTNANKINSLLEKYNNVNSLEEAEDEESDGYCNIPMSSMVEAEESQENIIRLLPPSLDKAAKGRAKKGHHLILFARPETGKTGEVITLLTGFALQKKTCLYFGNEDPVEDIINRTRACLTGMTYDELIAAPERAQALLDRRGWSYIRFFSCSPGSPAEIEKYVRKHKPEAVVVDQIRNLNVGAETRVNQLEMAATSMRNIGKRHGCLMVSVTQAGDSASNKLVLEMGDCDFSNTGIPAQADMMVGIGVNREYEEQGLRMFSTPKNKIGGTHGHWQVRFNPLISRYEDM